MLPVTISNRRPVAADDGSVSFRGKDYRVEGPGRWKTTAIALHELSADLDARTPQELRRRPANPRLSPASLRRTLHSDMTVSGHLFSKTTFDDIIV
jgi:hypothetical protein